MVRQLEFHPGGIPIANEGVYVCEESPPCCTECSTCLDGLSPRYFIVTLSGVYDNNPSDCPACTHYNATYTLRRANAAAGEPGIGGICAVEAIDDADKCCWICYPSPDNFECPGYFSAPNALSLTIATVATVRTIYVTLIGAGGGGNITWSKTYPSTIDCRNIVEDSLTYLSSTGSPPCGAVASTITISSAETIEDHCCRGICYPDETPGPITVVVSDLSNLGGGGDCTDCASLNGTYVVSRKNTFTYGDETDGCWIGSFPETCGMDRIKVSPGVEVEFYKNGDPLAPIINFNTSHYFPFTSYFTAPYANCAQFDGMEFRTSGDGYCGVGGSYPTFYGKAVISF